MSTILLVAIAVALCVIVYVILAPAVNHAALNIANTTVAYSKLPNVNVIAAKWGNNQLCVTVYAEHVKLLALYYGNSLYRIGKTISGVENICINVCEYHRTVTLVFEGGYHITVSVEKA